MTIDISIHILELYITAKKENTMFFLTKTL